MDGQPSDIPLATTMYLDRGEGRVAYDLEGKGPLVVCLPGMGELRSSYRHTRPALVAAGFRVAAMDLRGHGDSDITFTAYNDVAAGQDALALVAELGGPATLVGNSMSAGAAVWAAAEQPQAVTGLVLIGPFVRNVPMNPILSWAFRVAMSGPWARRVWISYLPKLSPGQRPHDYQSHLDDIAASMRRPGRTKSFTATTRTSHAPAEARLGQITAPTLVIMGAQDPDFPEPIAEARYIAQHMGGDVIMVDGAGHYPHTDYPEVVNPALVAFAKEVSSKPR